MRLSDWWTGFVVGAALCSFAWVMVDYRRDEQRRAREHHRRVRQPQGCRVLDREEREQ